MLSGQNLKLPNLRKLWLASLLVILAPFSWSLGLGEIDLNSALNEKLDATIELYDSTGLAPTEIIVTLASADDFRKVGVERFFFLTDIRFEVSTNSQGEAYVKIKSTQAVSEPYLNFLVELLWPNGRLLKEYTLLLDPPTFSQTAAPQVSAPEQRAPASSTSGAVQRSQSTPTITRQATTTSSGTQVRTNTANAPRRTAVPSGMTQRTDTLWAIASRSLPSSAVTVNQQMLAIKRLNPEAFISDNVNLVKAGHVLRMPSENEALAIAALDADKKVKLETEEWRAVVRGENLPQSEVAQSDQTSDLKGQVDASAPKTTKANTSAATDGQLKIVAGDGDRVAGSEATSADGQSLAAVLEERDALKREVEALAYAADQAKELNTKEVTVKERQLEVKDQEIADLQTQLQELKVAQGEAAANRTENPAQSEAPQLNVDADTPWWQSPYVMGTAVGVALLGGIYALLSRRRKRALAAEEDFYDQLEAEQGVEPSFEDEEPIIAEVEDEDYEEREETDDVGTSLDDLEDELANEMSGFDSSNAGAEDEDDEFDTLFDTDDEDQEEAGDYAETEAGLDEPGDVLGEADIYIAYGRYPQAISLLTGVLDGDPDQHHVRHKLLELYVETNDPAAFETQKAALVADCEDEEILATIPELEARLTDGDLEHQADPIATALGTAAVATGAIATAGVDSAAEDFTGSEDTVDDLELDLDAGSEEFFSSEDADTSAEMTEDLDFELELEPDADLSAGAESVDNETFDVESSISELEETKELLEEDAGEFGADDFVVADSEESTSSGDDLGGDLGLDFNPQANDDDFSLDGLDAEFDTTAETVAEESTEEFSLDVDSQETSEIDDSLDSNADTGAEEVDVEMPEVDDDFDLGLDTDDANAEFNDDFEFDEGDDGASTKLDLAKAYIDMGDEGGARDILNEVIAEGDDQQQKRAQELLETI